jgi:hypothetical protein
VKGGRDQIRLEEACRGERRGRGSMPRRPIRVRGASSVARLLQKETVAASQPLSGPKRDDRLHSINFFERHDGFCNICLTREGSRCFNQHQPLAWYLILVAKAAYSNSSALVGMSSCKISGASCRTAPNRNYYLLRDTDTDAAGKSPATQICKLTIPL